MQMLSYPPFVIICFIVRTTPLNIAENQPTWQNSVLAGGESLRAVDGGLSTDFDDNSCSHTDVGHAIWSVDLGGLADIYYVDVLNRGK